MVHLLGQHSTINFGNLRVWPENGMIKIEDKRDGSYKAIDIHEARARASALNDFVFNSISRHRTTDAAFYADELRAIKFFVQDLLQACVKAEEQGSPTNPEAIRDRLDRRPRSVSFSDGDFQMATGRQRPLKVRPPKQMLGDFD